jgi:hypothetical protein
MSEDNQDFLFVKLKRVEKNGCYYYVIPRPIIEEEEQFIHKEENIMVKWPNGKITKEQIGTYMERIRSKDVLGSFCIQKIEHDFNGLSLPIDLDMVMVGVRV